MSNHFDPAAILGHIHQDEVVDFVRGIAEIPSFSGDEKACAEYVAERMRAWGFDQVLLPEAEPGRPNAIGILKGDGSGPSFMFNGHLDVDPVPSGWKWPLWQTVIQDGMMHCHGIQNMKGGVGAMVLAAVALKRSGIPRCGDLTVACVVGELQGGIGTAHHLSQGLVPDLAIVPEPTGLSIRTIHAGCAEFLITVRGQTAWVGQQHSMPHVNAIYQMRKALAALQDMRWDVRPHPELPTLPHMVAGAIIGGYSSEYYLKRPAFHADTCTVAVDVRLTPYMTLEQVFAQIRAALEPLTAADPDFHYEVEPPPAAYRPPFRASKYYSPPNEIAKDDPLVLSCAAWHRQVTGQDAPIGPHIPGSRAWADSGLLHAAGTRCFNYGPTMHSGFTDGLAIANLMTATRVLALTAADVCTRRKGEV